MIRNTFLAFIPVFVAVNAIGVLPIFVALTRGVSGKVRKKVILDSLVTALMLAFGFVFLGKAVFALLGISVGDFMIAGGLVLFCIAIIDVVDPGRRRKLPMKELGAVPLGTPLIVGPAVLTTSLVIIPAYGLVPTLISITVNIMITGVMLMFSDNLIRVLGESGTKALSKVIALLLAAIAVMLVRKGVMLLLG
ncbi:MAG: MarC family protein [Candidatus Omnitrophota bacterium]